MRFEGLGPPLRVSISGTAGHTAFGAEACEASGSSQVDQPKIPGKPDLAQSRLLQLDRRDEAGPESASANRFHEGAVLVRSQVEDTVLSVRGVPSVNSI